MFFLTRITVVDSRFDKLSLIDFKYNFWFDTMDDVYALKATLNQIYNPTKKTWDDATRYLLENTPYSRNQCKPKVIRLESLTTFEGEEIEDEE